MTNYEKLKKALDLAISVHENQTDKAGQDYIFHPILVALQCDTIEEKIVGLLHDVVEDSEGKVTIEIIEKEFGKDIAEAIKQLTHDKNEDYFEYVDRIDNKLALKVKLSDLTTNMDLARLPVVRKVDEERVEKYRKAKEIIESKNSKSY